MKEQSPKTETPTTKTCKACGAEKPLSDFGRDLTTPDGYKYVCRACRCSEYRKQHGGTSHALRNFTSAELAEEIVRRKAAASVLEKLSRKDIEQFLKS